MTRYNCKRIKKKNSCDYRFQRSFRCGQTGTALHKCIKQTLLANLAIWRGDVDWVQLNDSEETQLWKIDGQTAVLMSKNNAIVILDDDWVSEVTMDKVAPFIAEITAWSGV